MTPLDLTHTDQRMLNHAACDRFREVFPLPELALIFFSQDNQLIINAPLALHVDELVNDHIWLKEVSRFMFGTDDIAIWFSGNEVWHSKAKCGVISEVSTLPIKDMRAAVLDRPTQASPVIEGSMTPIDDLAAEMATIMNRPVEECRSLIINSSPVLFVPVAAATSLLDHQIDQLKAMKDRLKPSIAQAQSANGKKPATQKSAAQKPAAQKSTAQKSAAQKPAAQKSAGQRRGRKPAVTETI